MKVNLLDTPGYADFVGELRAGLRAADCALFVLAANEGVDEPTRTLWRECAEVDMPRVVVVTKLDHARADYDGVAAPGPGRRSGTRCCRSTSARATAWSGCITGDAGTRQAHEQRARRLIEGVIEESEDETLMERYLGGEEVDAALLVGDLETGGRARLVPPRRTRRLRHRRRRPRAARPGRRRLPVARSSTRCPRSTRPPASAGPDLVCDPDGPLVAEVVKTTTDAYVGRVSLVRVFSGTVRPDATVHVSGHLSQFAGRPSTGGPRGPRRGRADRRAVGAARQDPAARRPGRRRRHLRDRPADPRRDRGHPVRPGHARCVLRPWTMPEPLLPVAIEARAKADEDKLGQGLARLAAEDPTLRIEHNAETHQIVLWTMGEAHADVLLDRLEHRHGVAVDQVELRVPLRETFAAPAVGHGRHVKQSGGHGQFAVCDIEVEPLPGGSGFEFVDKVVGGAVPRQFVPSVEKGLRAQMERGLAAGYPVVDIRVTLTDGKSHSVDSSDMAFQTAAALALREAAAATRTCAARAGRRGRRARARRAGRRGDERPVRATRPGARQRAGRRRPHAGAGRGAAGRDRPLRHRPARRSRTAPRPSPAASCATSRCPTPSPTGSSSHTLVEVPERAARGLETRASAHEVEGLGSASATATGVGAPGSARVGGVDREPRPRRQVRLAVLDQLVVRRLAHQRDQLGLVGDVQRLAADVRLGVAGAVPVQVVAARRPSRGGRTRRS